MARSYLDPPCPVAALATRPGTAALAVVRTAGPGSIELAARCFSPGARLAGAPAFSLVHGFVMDPDTGERIDEALAAVFRSPRGPTGEDGVEFSLHGSMPVVRRTLAALESAGFQPALPGEFSFRALLNGKTDLLRAEAVEELASSRTDRARAEAVARLGGALSRIVSGMREEVLGILAGIEARLDYPEDEGPEETGPAFYGIPGLLETVRSVAATHAVGRIHREGALVVIAGRPNAGKSSLFNMLIREDRSIVSHEPGTTRDWIEAWIDIEGTPVRLVDTAGIRESASDVEGEGVRRSRELARNADCLLYVVDGISGLDPEDRAFIADHPRAVQVWNKLDSGACSPPPPGFAGVSARTGSGCIPLVGAIAVALPGHGGSGSGSAVVVASDRQKLLLDRTAGALSAALASIDSGASLDILALDLREAAGYLGEMTGEILNSEILDTIFSKFCLGK